MTCSAWMMLMTSTPQDDVGVRSYNNFCTFEHMSAKTISKRAVAKKKPVTAMASTKRSGSAKPSEDRRAVILDATLRLIATDGVDAVTHRRVAAVADVPLGSTTYYFESREQL